MRRTSSTFCDINLVLARLYFLGSSTSTSVSEDEEEYVREGALDVDSLTGSWGMQCATVE